MLVMPTLLDQGISFHQQAEQAREEKNYEKALALYAQALFILTSGNHLAKVSEIYAAQSILFRHLVSQTDDLTLKEFWKMNVQSNIELSLKTAQLAEKEGDPTGLAMAYFNAAKFAELEGDFLKAHEFFSEAVEYIQTFPPQEHNRPAVYWDFKLKLALNELQLGNKSAINTVLTAIDKLENDNGVDAAYNVKVWVSGAYLRLARHFKDSDETKAIEYLKMAEEIILNDKNLVVRKEEYEKLMKEFDSSKF